jgi:hypothetical protein
MIHPSDRTVHRPTFARRVPDVWALPHPAGPVHRGGGHRWSTRPPARRVRPEIGVAVAATVSKLRVNASPSLCHCTGRNIPGTARTPYKEHARGGPTPGRDHRRAGPGHLSLARRRAGAAAPPRRGSRSRGSGPRELAPVGVDRQLTVEGDPPPTVEPVVASPEPAEPEGLEPGDGVEGEAVVEQGQVHVGRRRSVRVHRWAACPSTWGSWVTVPWSHETRSRIWVPTASMRMAGRGRSVGHRGVGHDDGDRGRHRAHRSRRGRTGR